MSSDGDDDPQSPSAFLQAPSSQSVVVDAEPFTSQSKVVQTSATRFDQDSSEEERENRFSGPASTWRDYTANERALVVSLDQERAGDLGIHLYNAHALKSRLYDRSAADASKPWHNKHHWIKPDEDEVLHGIPIRTGQLGRWMQTTYPGNPKALAKTS